MTVIDVFYQGEDLQDIHHLQIDGAASFGDLKKAIIAACNVADAANLFLEDEDEPVSDCTRVCDHATDKGLRIHISRCRRIAVEVTFNGQSAERKFTPSQTLARVKRWAARRGFNMSKEEAGEHALQIEGTHDRPPLNTHVGSLTSCGDCSVKFDLVPDERINGFEERADDWT